MVGDLGVMGVLGVLTTRPEEYEAGFAFALAVEIALGTIFVVVAVWCASLPPFVLLVSLRCFWVELLEADFAAVLEALEAPFLAPRGGILAAITTFGFGLLVDTSSFAGALAVNVDAPDVGRLSVPPSGLASTFWGDGKDALPFCTMLVSIDLLGDVRRGVLKVLLVGVGADTLI